MNLHNQSQHIQYTAHPFSPKPVTESSPKAVKEQLAPEQLPCKVYSPAGSQSNKLHSPQKSRLSTPHKHHNSTGPRQYKQSLTGHSHTRTHTLMVLERREVESEFTSAPRMTSAARRQISSRALVASAGIGAGDGEQHSTAN